MGKAAVDVPSFPMRNHRKGAFWYLALLIGLAISLSGYEANVGAGNLTLERAVALPLAALSAFIFIGRHGRLIEYSPFVLGAWLSIAFLSGATSEVAGWALKMWVVLVLAAVYYFMPLFLRANIESVFSAKPFGYLAWLLGPAAVCVYLLGIAGAPLPDFLATWLQEGSGGTRVRATIVEANLFGCFITPIILIAFANANWKSVKWWGLIVGLHLALILSFSRAPWVAHLCALLIYIFLSYPKRYTSKRLSGFFGKLIFSSIFLLSILTVLFVQFSDQEIVGRTNTIAARLIMWELATEDVMNNPVLGTGIFSFSELHPSAPSEVGSDTYRAAWISNLFLAIVHDTGIIGSILFLGFVAIVIFRGWRAIRVSVSDGLGRQPIVRYMSALVASAVALMISGQSIPAHSLGFFWLTFGLIDRGVMQLRGYRRRSGSFSGLNSGLQK